MMHEHACLLPATPPGWHARLGTLANALCVRGRGLHTARAVTLRVLPVPVDAPFQGVVFRRVRKGRLVAQARVTPEGWHEALMCSSLHLGGGVIARTVEHLLAALLMCEIDSAVIEMDGEEVPFLDACAQEWIHRIRACGRVELPLPKRFIQVVQACSFKIGKARYHVKPAAQCVLHGVAREPDLQPMEWRGSVNPAVFAQELAGARSFGHLRRLIPALLASLFMREPVVRGALFSNAALICNHRVLGGMRMPDEMARHRLLDFVGDLAFAGMPILGELRAAKPSHARNHAFLKQFLAAKDAWRQVVVASG